MFFIIEDFCYYRNSILSFFKLKFNSYCYRYRYKGSSINSKIFTKVKYFYNKESVDEHHSFVNRLRKGRVFSNEFYKVYSLLGVKFKVRYLDPNFTTKG